MFFFKIFMLTLQDHTSQWGINPMIIKIVRLITYHAEHAIVEAVYNFVPAEIYAWSPKWLVKSADNIHLKSRLLDPQDLQRVVWSYQRRTERPYCLWKWRQGSKQLTTKTLTMFDMSMISVELVDLKNGWKVAFILQEELDNFFILSHSWKTFRDFEFPSHYLKVLGSFYDVQLGFRTIYLQSFWANSIRAFLN